MGCNLRGQVRNATVRSGIIFPTQPPTPPSQVSDLFFSILWGPLGEGIDANTAALRASLITPNASGVVFDIGAGLSDMHVRISRNI